MKRSIGITALAVIVVLAVLIIFLPFPGSTLQQVSETEAKAQTWHLRFGHNTPLDSALHEAAQRFADEVARKSGGRVNIEVFPAQKLGNDHQMVEMARRGELDILLTPTAKMSVAVPSMQYADLPFYFPAREDVYEMLDGEPGRMLLEDLQTIGLIGVTFWENGFKHFTGNKPLLRPEDFNGLDVRVMKSRIIMEQFRSFEANPVPIDFHATRKALADGVVDAQENPLVAIVSMGFHEVQSDLTLSSHGYLGYVFSISAKVFQGLPNELRTMLVETAKEVTPWEREETARREQKLLETIRQAGVQVHTLDESERKRFAALTAYIPKRFESVIGSDVISKTEELLMAKYGPAPDSGAQIVIGIDTDLSMGGKVSGLAIKRGVELAVDEINARGGVLGKKLAVIARDHRGVASKGVDNIKDFIARPDVVAVIGGQHSAVILDEMERIQEAKIPYLVAWAAASEVISDAYSDNAVFRVSADDHTASAFIVDDTLKRHRRPALIVENSTWGRGNLKRMAQYMEKRGVKPVAEFVFNRGQEGFSRELEAIVASGADSIVMVADPIEGGAIVREVAAMETALPIVSHWGIVGGTFFRDNRKALERVDLRFFQNFSFSRQRNPQSVALVDAYRKQYDGGAIMAPGGVVQAYDLVQLLAMAIEKAGSIDRSKVRDALEHLPPYDGVVKRYAPAFSESRHDALDSSDYFMARFAADGSIVAVEQ